MQRARKERKKCSSSSKWYRKKHLIGPVHTIDEDESRFIRYVSHSPFVVYSLNAKEEVENTIKAVLLSSRM